MDATVAALKDYLQFVALQFIAHPEEAQLRIARPADNVAKFRLVLAQPDVATLIGRNGHTASTIRGLAKAAAERDGLKFHLTIHSHEEEQQYLAALEAKEIEE